MYYRNIVLEAGEVEGLFVDYDLLTVQDLATYPLLFPD